jgi:ankyrin repeat protein
MQQHLLVGTLAIACLVGSIGSADCDKLCDRDWWKTATAADVQAELDAGAEVTARDQYGSTPLHEAAGNGSAEGIQALLDAGADPKVKDGLNKAPWLYAQFNKRLKYVEDYWPLLIRSIN